MRQLIISLIAIIAASLLTLVMTASAVGAQGVVYVHFICTSADQAEAAALTLGRDAVPDVTPMPNGCQWLTSLPMDERRAEIVRIDRSVPLDDGRVALIGLVRRPGHADAWSAGISEIPMA